eukprot:7390038-Prymnesium_polylepis.3
MDTAPPPLTNLCRDSIIEQAAVQDAPAVFAALTKVLVQSPLDDDAVVRVHAMNQSTRGRVGDLPSPLKEIAQDAWIRSAFLGQIFPIYGDFACDVADEAETLVECMEKALSERLGIPPTETYDAEYRDVRVEYGKGVIPETDGVTIGELTFNILRLKTLAEAFGTEWLLSDDDECPHSPSKGTLAEWISRFEDTIEEDTMFPASLALCREPKKASKRAKTTPLATAAALLARFDERVYGPLCKIHRKLEGNGVDVLGKEFYDEQFPWVVPHALSGPVQLELRVVSDEDAKFAASSVAERWSGHGLL